ncbi:MAG: diacylglycerol kinase family lipid kinase [Anaerolineales bacterium]|nr:diacylglycerol kinase family lipid kinase [Anaerolineales bacterium]
MRYKIIVNPISGRGAGGKSIPFIQKNLLDAGLEIDLETTERPCHATELAQKAVAEGYEIVVSVGGDGTANEVINGLMAAKESLGHCSSMGIIGVGRGNDFAFGMGIPTGLEPGCQTLIANNRRMIDIGKATSEDYPQGRYFGNGVGIGFDAVVGFVAVKMKRLSGFPSYIVAALKTVFLYYHAPFVKITIDNGESFEISSLMISIMNGRRMGGGFLMAPDSISNDGKFDLCIAREVDRLRIFSLIPHFMRGTQMTQKEIRFLRTSEVSVNAIRGHLPSHADGETISVEGKHITAQIIPNQLEIIGL